MAAQGKNLKAKEEQEQDKNEQKQLNFHGHGTFTPRYGWLYKVVKEYSKGNKPFTKTEKAMVDFGVGKNMVPAMKHWAKSFDVYEESHLSKEGKSTPFGEQIFGENGWDKYLEDRGTLWLLHWKLVSSKKNYLWWWTFNIFNDLTFDKRSMYKAIKKHLEDKGYAISNPNANPEGKKVPAIKKDPAIISAESIKRDIDCLINTYRVKELEKNEITENTLQSPLAELGLIKETKSRGIFKFERFDKKNIPSQIFFWTIADYWRKFFNNENTLQLKQIVYDVNSPGKIFKLDESTIVSYLSEIEKSTRNKYSWIDTLASRQLQRNSKNIDIKIFLKRHFNQ